MKRVFARITAAILIFGSLTACAPDSDLATESGSIRVLAPRNNAQGKYELEVSELKGIDDVKTLTGKFVRFFLSPRILNNRLDGVAPRTRFIRNGSGDYIPSDEITQHLASIYFHMQSLAGLDEELGAAGVNRWPRDIAVGVKVQGAIVDNAFYDSQTDSILFVPYMQSGLAIPINGGILAHEHFHSLFFHLVTITNSSLAQVHDRNKFLENMSMVNTSNQRNQRKMTQFPFAQAAPDNAEMREYYRSVMTFAMNEGLADYWGWMYTGDPDFIVQSIPDIKATRTLEAADNQSVFALPVEEHLMRELRLKRGTFSDRNFAAYLRNYSYVLGTKFSRALKRYADIYAQARGVESLQARRDIGKIIIKTLPLIKQKLESLDQEFVAAKVERGYNYTSIHFLESFTSQLGKLMQEECAYLAEVLNHSKNTDENAEYLCKEDGTSWQLQSKPIVANSERVALRSRMQ